MNQKIYIKIIQHNGVITMRECVIDYVVNVLLPVLETTITGQMYYQDVIGAKFTWDHLLIKLYLDFYRIKRELDRLKSPDKIKIVKMLAKIKSVPTLNFAKLKKAVDNAHGAKGVKELNLLSDNMQFAPVVHK